MSERPHVRFAPSPTGHLHVGNLRLAVINWLFARSCGGRVLLRLDDTDQERSTAAFAEAIVRDLAWLGLVADHQARQSDRLARYREATAQLIAADRLYPCYETPEELERMRRRLKARGRPPVYDRAALGLTADARTAFEAEGRRPHWRFRLDDRTFAWHDLVRGPVEIAARDLSDPVLVRADGRPLYTLSSVVDDADFAISHVIRGEDHVTNTAVQIDLFDALGAPVPTFAHVPLMTDAAGQGLSKRLGSLSVGALRTRGIERLALASLLARVGTSEAIALAPSLAALAADFAFDKISRAPARFDEAGLDRLNARLLHEMPWSEAEPRLTALGYTGLDAAFWETVQPNLVRWPDVEAWWRIAAAPVAPVIVDPEVTTAAAARLPEPPWGDDTWDAWIAAVRAATDRRGKALFRPLRLALTGRDDGPELRKLLPLIGRARAADRLAGRTA